MGNKKFYAMQHLYGSIDSRGFANDREVFAFSSERARNDYVDKTYQRNITVCAIKACKVTKFAKNYSLSNNRMMEPKPFSGEFWGITDVYLEKPMPNGMIGQVDVIDPNNDYPAMRLYKR